MADGFTEREVGFENRFAWDEDLRFKALARRNKAVGLWAATLLGRSGDAAEAYADALVGGQVGRSDEALVADLAAQFAAAGLDMSAHRIARTIAQAMIEAQAKVHGGR